MATVISYHAGVSQLDGSIRVESVTRQPDGSSRSGVHVWTAVGRAHFDLIAGRSRPAAGRRVQVVVSLDGQRV